ncbi:MAG: UDP-N-acetylmuramoylalanyl-D-glutamyl-2, 6-diaminopimelate--D-alanyl-D-alanine ligase, partial [Alphaproteobacteria bacterium]|nr:UDP-N-acetylmuramoylalanyl-D-glutamyl-2, 6-diaminopimelate--D-alanyl-D-alanine ligase [Alphaproteobacteria bacterium]
EFFASIAEIADAKAEIFVGLEPGGTVVLNRDNPFFERLSAAARAAGAGRVDSFGWHIESAARLLDCALDPKNSSVFALVGDDTVAYRLSVPGLQWVMNSLCVLLAARAAGADLARAAASLAHMQPPHGRGERFCLALPGGSVEIIDESYNASPVSMRAAFHTLALAKPAKGARRIAELGAHAEALHAALAAPLAERGIDLVFTAGARMRTLHEALPKSQRGGHAESSDLLAPAVKAALLPGDVVMVKGSAGSRMGRVVKVLLGEA